MALNKTPEQRSNAAYRTVLAHNTYAGIDSTQTSTEDQISELLKGLRILCDEYNVDFDQASQID